MDLLEVFDKAVNNLEQSLPGGEVPVNPSEALDASSNIYINREPVSKHEDTADGDGDIRADRTNLSHWTTKVRACESQAEIFDVLADFRHARNWLDSERATMSRVYIRKLESLPSDNQGDEKFSPAVIGKYYHADMPRNEAITFLTELKKLGHNAQSFYWRQIISWIVGFPDEQWASRQYELLAKELNRL